MKTIELINAYVAFKNVTEAHYEPHQPAAVTLEMLSREMTVEERAGQVLLEHGTLNAAREALKEATAHNSPFMFKVYELLTKI